ncbi:hypothetical protein XAP7430_580039 [Xanthomonas phaseoli pv. phaseoli]|uniref:Uncharacterized protein n=1 Tax=Xanthomonas campestris pv. phaseoli TaxID=317013 RepID=A0AB38E2V2_XANCH|nr:hypothetical protein XAP7430_580039 [Xanthomonas phaseoli pv. phaseoli]
MPDAPRGGRWSRAQRDQWLAEQAHAGMHEPSQETGPPRQGAALHCYAMDRFHAMQSKERLRRAVNAKERRCERPAAS